MAIYSLNQRIFMVKRYYQNGNSTEKVKNEFIIEYSNKPSDKTIVQFVQMFENFGTVQLNDVHIKLELNADSIKQRDAEDSANNSFILEQDNTNKYEDHPLSNFSEISEQYSETYDTDINGHSDRNDKLDVETNIIQPNHVPETDNMKISLVNDISAEEKMVFEPGGSVEDTNKNDIGSQVGFNEKSDSSNTGQAVNTLEVLTVYKQPQLATNSKILIKCKVCNEEFLTKPLLEIHFKIHTKKKTGITSDKHKCNICEKTYFTSSALRRHIDYEHKGKKPHQCSSCDKRFYQKTSLEIHKRVHTGEKPYVCSHCSRAFGDRSTCKRHERTHTGERPYPCSMCGHAFSQRSNLNSHLTTVHKQITTAVSGISKTLKEIVCTICGKTFHSSVALKQHMRTHTGEKPYKCQLCPKQFALSANLTIHKRTHTGEKPFMCDICGKLFVCNNLLNLHYHNIHTNNKPYECSFCDKKFNNKKSKITHERIHTGEKPYICPHCSKAFADYSTCRRHQLTHTGEKRYKCTVCEKKFSATSNLKAHLANVHKQELFSKINISYT